MTFEQFKRIIELMGFSSDKAVNDNGLFKCPTGVGFATCNSMGTVNIRRKGTTVSKAGFIRFSGVKFLQERGVI